MLKLWRLRNFKSISESREFELAPLTIFAGANSSGKSTVIQSILLVSQTLKNQFGAKPIIINGEIVNLGSYEDIVFRREVDRDIEIGFSINESEMMARANPYRPVVFPRRTRSYWFRDVSCDFTVSSYGKSSSREISLESCFISAKYLSKKIKLFSAQKTALSVNEKKNKYNIPDVEFNPSEAKATTYDVTAEYPYGHMLGDKVDRPIGASFHHFLPNKLFGVQNEVEQFVGLFFSFLYGGMFFPFASHGEDIYAKYFSQICKSRKLKKIFRECFESEVKSIDKKRPRFKRINQYYSNLMADFSLYQLMEFFDVCYAKELEIIRNNLRTKESEIRTILFDLLGEKRVVVQSSIEESSELPVDFFAHKVKYLGPLREEPRIVYSSAEISDSKYVGNRGEYTPYVLDIHKNTDVEYVTPPNSSSDSIFEQSKQQASLLKAVVHWLKYLGVATNFTTKDLEKYGQSIQISTDGESYLYDITHVGVGVSQVLPIVVMSLLAKSGSTLIFEQPELHLHPRVQTRLADFFCSMNMLGKQCIVETHSEYMVDQLRYLSAISNNEIVDNALIYFVEKDENGSTYRDVHINKYGVIEDWPKGFFDENRKKASEILLAGMNKRKREGK